MMQRCASSVYVLDGQVRLPSGTVTVEVREAHPEEHSEAGEVTTLAPGEAPTGRLGVHPDARRRGVAKLLMAACFERARERGKTRMTLHTTHRMQAAQAMYEGLGFRRLPDRVFPE